MPLLIDYEYSGVNPAPVNWKGLQPDFVRLTPSPKVAASKSPKFEKLYAIPKLSIAQFHWHATTMGYGESAQYVVMWMLKSGKLTAADVADLRRLTRTRAQTILRAYNFSFFGGVLHITPKEIYSLLDPTEKGLISYYIGSAMASICGPAAIALRGALGSKSTINYLFHSKVLEANAAFGHKVTIQVAKKAAVFGAPPVLSQSLPDYIGIDASNMVHIFEAKGEGSGTLYPPIADGLDQCDQVVSVTSYLVGAAATAAPASINLCASFLSKTEVMSNLGKVGSSVRCAVVSLPPKPIASNNFGSISQNTSNNIALASSLPDEVVQQLIGTRLLGLHGHLLIGHKSIGNDDWIKYHFSVEEGFENEISLAVPKLLVAKIERAVEEVEVQWTKWKKATELSSLLKSSGPKRDVGPFDLLLQKILIELGKSVVAESGRLEVAAPQGYSALFGDSWVCVAANNDSSR